MAKLYYIAPVEFSCQESPVAVGTGKDFFQADFAGEILGGANDPCITGCITDAGTGADGTDIQIRNVTQARNYFPTASQFRVADKDTNGRAVLHKGTLSTQPSFRAGDVLALDVPALPGNSDSERLRVTLLCGFWREVS